MEPRKPKAVRIRPKSPAAPAETAHRVAVFTAVDGTLPDARSAIARLAEADVPVIPVSVMTLEELEPIAASLGLRRAMIIEAGGAIARWNGRQWEVEPCGPPAETLLDVIRDIEDRSGASLLVYSALPEMLEASARRRFSEPFLIESGDLASVQRAAAEIGFSVRAGRRFLHLCRECDEGEAFARVRDELRCETAIAIGGAPVDAEFLSRADVAFEVSGPEEWAAAVEDILRTLQVAM